MELTIKEHHAEIIYYILTEITESDKISLTSLQNIAKLTDTDREGIYAACEIVSEALEDSVLNPIP